MSASVHVDNRMKDILILCKEAIQGLDDTTMTAKGEFSINFIDKVDMNSDKTLFCQFTV